ncbi:MAG: ATP synthase F1 subunit delta [Geobacteraceae bacterium]|nr:ATP synthase F1 subunit delta [Geobacteraceae bacterium]
MSANAIARRYAKALIQIAVGQRSVEQYYTELQGFSRVLDSNPDAMALLSDPGIQMNVKRTLVKDLVVQLGISKTIGDFILLLLDKKRLYYLSQITSSYRTLGDEAAGILRSTITSALPLTENQVSEMRSALEKTTGKKIILDVATDSSLIGGVVTRIDDKVLDGSIRTQLTKIQDILQKG